MTTDTTASTITDEIAAIVPGFSGAIGPELSAVFTVVSDPRNALAGALGIVTAPSTAAQRARTALGFAVKDSNADDTPAIPYPSVIVVDADRRIAFADIKADYTQRTETSEILAAVDAL